MKAFSKKVTAHIVGEDLPTSEMDAKPLEQDVPVHQIQLDIDALIAKITPSNQHFETSWGSPVGLEAE
jgi:antitoxin component of MazEF toxin-antitoxin module